jgi:Chaperone of endosialidase
MVKRSGAAPSLYAAARSRIFPLAFCGALLALAIGGRAHACTPLPNTLTNGDTADATQVMGDFNGILGCPLFTGNVGIGTTAPDALLSLGSALDTVKVAAFDNGNASFLFGMGANAGELTFGAGIAANGTPGMVLTDGGRVGIATTSPGFTLEVDGSTWSTTGWSSASDGRLKQGVTTIPDALGTIERLRGVEFYWRPPSERAVGKTLALPLGEQQVGFVAQEVEKVVPEAVSTPAAGSDSPYGVNEAKIVAILVEAVKEQQVEIDQLKAQIAAARK